MRLILAIAFILAFGNCSGFAQASQRPAEGGTRWVSLFNGKDLTGWTIVGKERWVADEGAIFGESINKGNGFLKTEKTYKDFDLFMRFKCE